MVRRRLLLGVLLLVTACSSGRGRLSSATSTEPPSSSSSVVAPTSTPATTSAPVVSTSLPASTVGQPTTTVARRVVTAGDADNGKTIDVPAGSTLAVSLGANNWTFQPTSDPSVLSQVGTTTQQAVHCIPGGTCGTTSAQFAAHRSGQSQVVATRSYCGEAIRCTPATDHWSITVTVT